MFLPSGRTVWTVVGERGEYWAHPEMDYCSCPGHYFGKLSGREDGCYHVMAIASAVEQGMVDEVRFDDEEYAAFVARIMDDMGGG